MEEESGGSIWKSDNAESYILFEIKKEFISNMLKWDLEAAFWNVRLLRMELDAILQRKKNKREQELEKEQEIKGELEKGQTDNLLIELEKIRTEYNSLGVANEQSKGDYFVALENFYMHLCYMMKKHKIYFTESDDSRLAVLRR